MRVDSVASPAAPPGAMTRQATQGASRCAGGWSSDHELSDGTRIATATMARMSPTDRGIQPVFAIDRGSDKPLYRQVYESYRDAILERRLRAGDRLPSTRSLAVELGISRLPVLNAFEQLLAEGYCESRTGSGTYVAAALPIEAPPSGTTPVSGSESARPGPRTVSRSLALRLGPPRWVGGHGPFHVGRPALEHFPFRVWSSLVSRHARQLDVSQLRYASAAGARTFREAVARYLRTARGVQCSPEQIMATSGSQQALELVARVLLDPGSPVWIEEPSYWGARHALHIAGARLVPVPVDEEGLDVAAGIARCPQPRAVFVTPSHQFPLGATMSASRRLQLLDCARHAGAWLIEDDYNSEYRYEVQPVAALQGLDRDARVIYIGTFSKVLAPALRVGYLVLPPDLVESFATARWSMDVCPPPFFLSVLADFLDQGHFARHVRRTRQIYRDRRSALVAALREQDAGALEVLGVQAGTHLVATLPPGVNDVEVCERAAALGMNVMPLSSCYLGKPDRQGLVLGYGGVAVEEIPEAVSRLRGALRVTSSTD
jgi:GntR family transcriptional regulator / MocR family aminotransferase